MAFATSTCKTLQTSVTSRPGLVINRLNAKAARGCTTCTCSSHSGFCAKHARKAERTVARASTRVNAVATEITKTDNTEKFLHANEEFQSIFKRRDGELPAPPAKKVAVVTCMDARLHTSKFLGLAIGDAHVIRNAGGRVSIDALRSLVISQRMLGTEEVMVIHHTQCGKPPAQLRSPFEVLQASSSILSKPAWHVTAGMAGLENEALYKVRHLPCLDLTELWA